MSREGERKGRGLSREGEREKDGKERKFKQLEATVFKQSPQTELAPSSCCSERVSSQGTGSTSLTTDQTASSLPARSRHWGEGGKE